MFNRPKPGENAGGEAHDTPTPLYTAPLPQSRPHSRTGAELGEKTPIVPTKPPVDVLTRVSDPTKAPAAAAAAEAAPAPAPETKRLTVGRGISLSGKISSCDRLVVEGQVEAELQDCRTIEITETGTFKGAAEIENADISGRYDGSLTVRDALLIRGTGQISGNVRYGRLQIEQGGEINGDVKSLETK